MAVHDLTRLIKGLGHELGACRVGVAEATALVEEGAQLNAWLAAGHHASMEWMQNTAEVRCDPRHPGMLAEARSVVVFAFAYATGAANEPFAFGRVARYAQGRDYHNVLTKKLRKVAEVLRAEGFASRVAVDSKPVMERAWAERAGVGFVGKNCCLIVPGVGSHVFLGCVVTAAPLQPDAPMERRCGSCRLCLDVCPTKAFAGARRLDANRCISYLTIEHEGPIPEELHEPMGDWVFGCDACQDVCPYNQGASREAVPLPVFAPDPVRRSTKPVQLLAFDDARFAAWAEGSPLKRAKRAGLVRNIRIGLHNKARARRLPLVSDS